MEVTPTTYLALLSEELGALDIPNGPERLGGALANVSSTLRHIQQEMDAVVMSARAVDDRLNCATELALEAMSCLYASGAPHPIWRHWAGLSSIGCFMRADFMSALLFAVLGGEWELLPTLRRHAPDDLRPPHRRVLWSLAVGGDSPENLPEGDSVDRAWRELVAAIPAHDSAVVEAALYELVRFWILEDEDWETFPRGYALAIDPELCAAAALAKRHGFTPRALPSDVLRYLEPGLAEGWPEQAFPRLSPASMEHENGHAVHTTAEKPPRGR